MICMAKVMSEVVKKIKTLDEMSRNIIYCAYLCFNVCLWLRSGQGKKTL